MTQFKSNEEVEAISKLETHNALVNTGKILAQQEIEKNKEEEKLENHKNNVKYILSLNENINTILYNLNINDVNNYIIQIILICKNIIIYFNNQVSNLNDKITELADILESNDESINNYIEELEEKDNEIDNLNSKIDKLNQNNKLLLNKNIKLNNSLNKYNNYNKLFLIINVFLWCFHSNNLISNFNISKVYFLQFVIIHTIEYIYKCNE